MEGLQIIRQIGKGSNSTVSLVKELPSDRNYALKTVPLDGSAKSTLREVDLLAKLRHPHIVTYYRCFIHDDHLCMLFDFYDCGTLDDQVRRYRQLRGAGYDTTGSDDKCSGNIYIPEATVMRWFVQVAMALDFIHSRNVLHRDIKTSNIFLTRDNLVKLGDFGISKALRSNCSTTETCVGTPCYLSPELCRNNPYNKAADMWALGCLLYELCALKCAFYANNIISLFHKIVKGDYEDIPLVYSIEMSRLVHLLLAACPENRPTASAVLRMPYVRHHVNEFISREERMKTVRDERRKMLVHYHSFRQDSAASSMSRISLVSNVSDDLRSSLLSVNDAKPTPTLSLEGMKRRGRGMYRQARISQDLLSPDVHQSEPSLKGKTLVRAYSARADSVSPTLPVSPLTIDKNRLSAMHAVRGSRLIASFDESYGLDSPSSRPSSAQPSIDSNERSDLLRKSKISLSISRAQSDTDDIPEELPPDESDMEQSDYDAILFNQSDYDIEEALYSDSPDLELQRLRFHSRDDFDLSDNELEWAEVIGRANQCLSARHANAALKSQSTVEYSQRPGSKQLKDCSKSLSM